MITKIIPNIYIILYYVPVNTYHESCDRWRRYVGEEAP